MSRLARVLRIIWHPAHTRWSPRACETDRPASFAEIVAASAFLDFGGMPSGDWLHAWEASVEPDRRLKDEDIPAANVPPSPSLGNKCIGRGRLEEKTAFNRLRSQHAECDFTDDRSLLFRSRDAAPMLLFDELNGHPHMRLKLAAVDLAMCVAAFAFVVGTLVFAHPTSPAGHTLSAINAEARAASMELKPTETTLSGLAGGR
jgi:hypothetical protein